MSLIIKAGRLIDGRGKIHRDVEILIEEDKIIRVAPSVEASEETEVLDFSDMTVMPGLIDSHLHITSDGDPDPIKRIRRGIPYTTLIGAVQAKNTLEAGITAVRDAGAGFNTALDLKRAIDDGLVPGPRMMVSGQGLSITGGHGDPANGWPPEVEFLGRRPVDSPDEARKAAREELAYGADCIKIIATGGVMSMGTDHTVRGLTEEEMRAAIEEAKNRKKKTLAHAQGTEGIKNAIRAGINSIDHGFWIDDEAIEMMLDRDVFMVPTLAAVHHIVEAGTEKGVPPHAVEKAKIGQQAHLESFARALESGVKIAMGTDAGTPFNRHGNNAFELKLMVDAGMTPMQAIVS
ncbi:MAG: amidohydrolase family protein, partial [Bacillota bacterium]